MPKEVREHLGIEPGSEVTFEVRESEVVMRLSKAPAAAVEEYVSIITSKLKEKIALERLVGEEAIEETAARRQ